jgi:1,4-alpha-glucan branching enzyme
MSQAFDANGFLSLEHQARLHEIETRDSIFPDLDPALWSTGAHATPTPAPPPT